MRGEGKGNEEKGEDFRVRVKMTTRERERE
jgi:hypothetical protein